MEKITGTVDGVSTTLQAKGIVRLVRRRVVSAIETSWRVVLGYDLQAPTPKEDHPVPIELQRDIFRHMLTYEWIGEDTGRGVTT